MIADHTMIPVRYNYNRLTSSKAGDKFNYSEYKSITQAATYKQNRIVLVEGN